MTSESRIGTDAKATDAWTSFASATTAHEFCAGWLDVQMRTLDEPRSALLILEAADGRFAPAAIWPHEGYDIAHLAPAAEQALTGRHGVIAPCASPDGKTATVCIAYPVEIRGELFAAVVAEVAPRSDAQLRRGLRQLQWGAGWLEVLFRRRQAEADAARLERLGMAMELAVVMAEHNAPRAAAMALANAVTDRLGARAAAVGVIRRRRLQVLAMSRVAWFRETSHLMTALENAMDETLDQIAAVSWPELPQTEGRISLAHRALAESGSSGGVVTAPLLAGGSPVGALSVDFGPDAPPSDETVLKMEAVGGVAGSLLADKLENDRFLSGRAVRWLRRLAAALVDTRRVAAKLAVVLLIAAVAAVALARTTLRVTADATVEGLVQRVVTAPVDGFVETAPARAGDIVEEGALLARLDDRDLVLEAVRIASEKAQAEQELRNALAAHDRLEARLLTTRIEEADAQLRLNAQQRARLDLRAPIDGVVVSGDLSQRIGTPIERGDTLFEVAPLGAYRVALEVDEADVLLVEPGQSGELSLAAFVDARFAFEITSVTPVSTAADGRNFFRVEADILDDVAVLRPGMEGVGKIAIREATVIEAWTRRLVAWVRLQIWTLSP